MLFTESPPSPDPSCSCSPQLIKGSDISNLCGDEKASHGNNQPLQLKVDLSESGFDDRSIKLLSNFSIRDYVFSTRDRKDIKTHWPFSPRKLQLCLKHGVKDVLPPFETLECLRIDSTVEDSNTDTHLKITCLSKSLLLSPSPASNLRRKLLASDLGKNKCVKFQEGNKEDQSTKVFCNTQKKKRRGLLVKLSSLAVPQLTKEAMKTHPLAGNMSSKVCPVCKTFSSSSNTALNAHIDQCLSGVPMSSGVANSKVIKHRIKPRNKTRLMVDVYATALHCTLEDLDMRNGTNWASTSSGQAAHCLEETNSSVRAKEIVDKDPFSCKKFADGDGEGSVYVDSTGTKLRILSKFADLPSRDNAVDDCSMMKKIAKGDKGTVILSSRKKYLVQNFKLSKSSSHVKIPDYHCHKTTDGNQRNVSSKKGCKKFVAKNRSEPCDQVKDDDFGMVKQSVGSKRTTLKKKKTKEKNNMDREIHRFSKTMKNFRVKGGLSAREGPAIDSSSPLTAESVKRKKNLPIHSRNERMKHPRVRMRMEINDDLKRSDRPMDSTHNDGGKDDSSSALECFKDLRNDHTVAHVSSPSSSSGEEDVRKNVTSGVSKHQMVTKRKRKLCYVSDSDDEAIILRPDAVGQADLIGTPAENEYPGQQLSDKSSGNRLITNLKAQKKMWRLTNSADFCMDDNVIAGTPIAGDEVNKEVQSREPTCRLLRAESITTFFDDSSPLDGDRDLVISNNGADEGRGNYYYADFDTIPIPGPPGSFLPSPRLMGSDERIHGISSLTMGSSDSQVSATSIVSNSVADGSNSASVLDEVKIGATFEGSSLIIGSERGEELDKPSTVVRSRQCSLGFQESSQLLKRRNMNSLPLFPVQNQARDLLVSEHNHVGKSPTTAPNPILRLMGKNLMVVNREENLHPQTRPISAIGNEHRCYESDSSNVNNICNQCSHCSSSSHIITGEGPSTLNNSQSLMNLTQQHFEYGSSNGFSGNYESSSSEGFGYSVGSFNPNPMKVSRIMHESEEVQAHIVINSSTEAMNSHDVTQQPIRRNHGGGALARSSSSFSSQETRNAKRLSTVEHIVA